MEIKPKETFYDGHRFRSRLEARWAVFFNALNVPYEYEPEGFVLSDNKVYLPDFRVKCYGTRGDIRKKPFDLWIEVKGRMTPDAADLIKDFAKPEYGFNADGDPILVYHGHPVLVVGNIPPVGCSWDAWRFHSYEKMDDCDIYPFNYELIDGDHFAAYPAAHNGKFYLWGDDSNYIDFELAPQIEAAYDIARQARFEHGEKPPATTSRIDYSDYVPF